MNRSKKILVTGIALLMGITASVGTISSTNIKASDDTKIVKKLSPNSEYPNIKDNFDIKNMKQYSDDDLSSGNANAVTLNKFYVKDIGADPMKQYHALLTPSKHSHQYFLLVTESKKKIRLHDKVTVQGSLNGSGTINDSQINSGISSKFSGKKVVLVLPDKVAIYHK